MSEGISQCNSLVLVINKIFLEFLSIETLLRVHILDFNLSWSLHKWIYLVESTLHIKVEIDSLKYMNVYFKVG